MKVKTETGIWTETKKGLKTVRILGKCPICKQFKRLCVNDICEVCNNSETLVQCEHEWHPITQGTWNCTKCGEPY